MAEKEKKPYELRLRDFPRETRDKINSYRRVHQALGGGKKLSMEEAIVEMIDYSYMKLTTKKIINEQESAG